MRFRTRVELGGKTATGLPVPAEVLSDLSATKRAAVRVTIGGHTYRSTVGTMGGRSLVPLSAENRAAAGVSAGDDVEVDLVLDEEPREVLVPSDLATVLAQDALAENAFAALAFSHRKEWVRWVEEAKKPETRSSRITKTVEAVRSGKRTR